VRNQVKPHPEFICCGQDWGKLARLSVIPAQAGIQNRLRFPTSGFPIALRASGMTLGMPLRSSNRDRPDEPADDG
jgi:hypothetical protein